MEDLNFDFTNLSAIELNKLKISPQIDIANEEDIRSDYCGK